MGAENHRLVVRAFQATAEPHTCLAYIKKHKEVLAYYGIEMITSNNVEWAYNPNMYVMVAESLDNGELMGGIRVQLVDGLHPLPIEAATGDKDERVYELVNHYQRQGRTGEVNGLWTARAYKGIGISQLLISVSTAILSQLGATSLFGLCDTRNISTMRENGGYEVEPAIGNQGYFYYPKEGLLAWAILLKDPIQASKMTPQARKLIRRIRKNPKQQMRYDTTNYTLVIDFDMQLPDQQLPQPIPPTH